MAMRRPLHGLLNAHRHGGHLPCNRLEATTLGLAGCRGSMMPLPGLDISPGLSIVSDMLAVLAVSV
jgi:hypothetical protein